MKGGLFFKPFSYLRDFDNEGFELNLKEVEKDWEPHRQISLHSLVCRHQGKSKTFITLVLRHSERLSVLWRR